MATTNVNLIDPNEVISKLPPYMNGTPDYEKMHIFVELTAYRKGRTVLQTSNNGLTKVETGLEKDLTISMMGYDQTGNRGEHTTRYSFNTSISKNNYEGFGISDIKISTDSSFIPKVTIDFLDLRGNSLAQDNDAVYNVMFDFPPPLYELTIKGYYGRALKYQLHLVKYNISFQAKEGNFVTTAEFVARTFAPLTDLLFKYVEVFPFIETGTAPNNNDEDEGKDTTQNIADDDTAINADVRVRPKNTYELIKNLETLYDKISITKDTSEEAIAFEEELEKKNNIQSFYDDLRDFKERYDVDPTVIESGNFFVLNESRVDQQPDFEEVTLVEYNTYLQSTESDGVKDDYDKKLYLGFPIGDLDENGNFTVDENKSKTISRELIRIRKGIFTDATDIDQNLYYESNDNKKIIPTVTEGKENSYGIEYSAQSTNLVYKAIDITPLYVNIFRTWSATVNNANEKQKELVGKINQVVVEQLGMRPTIYNIFEIICDDIDKFFDKMKRTAMDAETHHEKYSSLIYSDNAATNTNGIKEDNIAPFPLFISAETVCNVQRRSRRMPSKENIGQTGSMDEFPEVELVKDFMQAFIEIEKDERVRNLKTQTDAIGNSKWIPATPADSELFDELDSNSPYYSLFGGGKSIDNIYNIFLNRFYAQSQFTYGYDFFDEEDKILKNTEALVTFLARSEAVNISQSITENNLINTLSRQVAEFQKDIQNFYNFLEENNIPNYNTIPNENFITLTNNTQLYRDRSNSGYIGIKLFLDDNDVDKITARSGQDLDTNKANSPVDNFINSSNATGEWWELETIGNWIGDLLGIEDAETVSNFVTQNIPLFPDIPAGQDYTSLYMMEFSDPRFRYERKNSVNFNNALDGDTTTESDVNQIIEDCFDITDDIVDDIDYVRPNAESGNFIDVWSEFLSYYDTEFKEFIAIPNTGDDTEDEEIRILQDVILTSNVLRTVGFFNKFLNINDFMKYPAVLTMPYYAPLYMGGLVKISKSPAIKKKLVEFIQSDLGQNMRKRPNDDPSYIGSTYIFYDLTKIDLLSDNDKEAFETAFDEFSDNESLGIKQNLIQLIENVENFAADLDISKYNPFNSVEKEKEAKYEEEFSTAGGFNSIPDSLSKTVYMLNLSQFTFNRGNDVTPTTYTPLSVLKDDPTKSTRVEKYFNTFFIKLKQTLRETEEELKELEDKFESSVRDNDISTQTYYSFKNINDKWIAGEDNRKIYGFPFNRNSTDRLINKFSFVDRAMNPIGDEVIINAEPLIEMSKDYDINVFTMFSRLLAHNGFEFFPLQNFMAYEENDWREDCWKIWETITDQEAVPSFVCMYLGGTSSFLKNNLSSYDDDGLDFNNMNDVTDFNSEGCPDQKEVINKPPINSQGREYPYSEVRAFRVRYAEQNQSIFNNVDIDSREYPETNESLAILSKIAQDQSTASPVAKAQNLYNTYESRAYSAKVDMFGNAMIQPTQYFQLENIPIFSGAYVILNVEHTINSNNQMRTSFSGVKVLKFPNPFVKEFATVVGINEGNSTDISGNNADFPPKNTSWGDGGAATLPEETKHNAIYDLQLKPEPPNLRSE